MVSTFQKFCVIIIINTFTHVFVFPVVEICLPPPGSLGWRQAEWDIMCRLPAGH